MSNINPGLAGHTKREENPYQDPRGFRMKREKRVGSADIRRALAGSLVDENGNTIVNSYLLSRAAAAVLDILRHEYVR